MPNGAVQSYPPVADADTRMLVLVVYGLYAGAVLTCGLAGLAGVTLAYIKRDDTVGTIWHSHFDNQIQAFWAWLGLFVVGVMTLWLFVGVLAIGFAFLYFLYRTIKGLLAAIEYRPYV